MGHKSDGRSERKRKKRKNFFLAFCSSLFFNNSDRRTFLPLPSTFRPLPLCPLCPTKQQATMADSIATSKLAKYPFLPYFKGESLRICVTGAGGFIASHLAKRLKAEGHYIVACDWKRNSYFAVSFVQ